MNPWVSASLVAAVVAVAVACVLVSVRAVRATRRTRAELQHQLAVAHQDVAALSTRLEALDAEVARTRRLAEARPVKQVEPFVITGVVADARSGDVAHREVQIVQAIESSRPQWLPARPVREVLVKTVSLGHGVRRALSPDTRDRISLEMRAEVRRSRRQRKAEVRALKRYLRERRKSAAA